MEWEDDEDEYTPDSDSTIEVVPTFIGKPRPRRSTAFRGSVVDDSEGTELHNEDTRSGSSEYGFNSSLEAALRPSARDTVSSQATYFQPTNQVPGVPNQLNPNQSFSTPRTSSEKASSHAQNKPAQTVAVVLKPRPTSTSLPELVIPDHGLLDREVRKHHIRNANPSPGNVMKAPNRGHPSNEMSALQFPHTVSSSNATLGQHSVLGLDNHKQDHTILDLYLAGDCRFTPVLLRDCMTVAAFSDQIKRALEMDEGFRKLKNTFPWVPRDQKGIALIMHPYNAEPCFTRMLEEIVHASVWATPGETCVLRIKVYPAA